MSSPTRLIAFATGMVGVFLLAMAAGKGFAPDKHQPQTPHVARHHLTLLDQPTAGKQTVTFQLESEGEPLSEDELDVVHEQRLHLIAVNEDLTGFQHVHPHEVDPGSQEWSAELTFSPGTWHLYGDFTETGMDPAVATTKVTVPGTPSTHTHGPWEDTPRAIVDGYTVDLRGSLDDGTLTPAITRGGKAITPEPYLGAQGHLVAIRHESFDYLHVHPSGATYMVEGEQPGTYELFLQFKHNGKVHTAQFTMKAAVAPAMEMDHADDH